MKSSSIRIFLRNLPIIRHLLVREIRAQKNETDLTVLRSLLTQEIQDRLKENAIRENPQSLHAFEHSVYSQNGEDGVIQEIFRRIKAPNQTFVEVGVGDGWENNTLFLHTLGWRGSWLDANPAFVSNIIDILPPHLAGSLTHLVAMVTKENAAELLVTLDTPQEPDLMSLDLDQNTHHIWQALSEYRPRLIVIEYNADLPPSVDWEVNYDPDKSWDGSLNYGASLKALERRGHQFGYRLVHCEFSGVNAFFVRNDLAADHFDPVSTAEHHYEPYRTIPTHRYNSTNRRVLLDRK